MSIDDVGDHVIVIGDPTRTHGRFSDYTEVRAVAAKRFDNATDTWAVTTADGRTVNGRVLVNTAASGDGVIATHGVPNYFRIPGPHTQRQARYVASLIAGMRRSGSTRIEARARAVRVHRLLPSRGLSRFHLTGSVGVDDEIYDGQAVLIHDGRDYPSRVRLTGHFDPIDGHYHWQGTLFADLDGERVTGEQVTVRIGKHEAAARVSERTPWGTLSVVGTAGYPPFPLENVEIALPPRI